MSEQSAGQRIAYIDFLKAFAIATVLLGHSVEQLSGDGFWDHPIWSFLYSFHMPLFMFVSGLFFKSSLRKGFGEVLRVKIVQLGIPSVTAFLLGLAIMKVVDVTAIADLCEVSFAGFMNSVWFLKCLLFCIVIMWLADSMPFAGRSAARLWASMSSRPSFWRFSSIRCPSAFRFGSRAWSRLSWRPLSSLPVLASSASSVASS